MTLYITSEEERLAEKNWYPSGSSDAKMLQWAGSVARYRVVSADFQLPWCTCQKFLIGILIPSWNALWSIQGFHLLLSLKHVIKYALLHIELLHLDTWPPSSTPQPPHSRWEEPTWRQNRIQCCNVRLKVRFNVKIEILLLVSRRSRDAMTVCI